jgi:hypothetical protein
MPYIDNAKRIKYEKRIQDSLNVLRKVPKENVDGELNYVITKILRGLYGPGRVVAPYEDNKIKEKGDA